MRGQIKNIDDSLFHLNKDNTLRERCYKNIIHKKYLTDALIYFCHSFFLVIILLDWYFDALRFFSPNI